MTDKKPTDKVIPANLPHISELPGYVVCLKIGPWRRAFTDEMNKRIIAEALNQCVKNKVFLVNGYLMTSTTLFLVLHREKMDLDARIERFYQQVRLVIEVHLHRLKLAGARFCAGWDHYLGDEINKHLFRRQYLLSPDMVTLLTGGKVKLPYYNRQLARLKKIIHDSDFCSAIDYQGGEGPVNVNIIEILN
ncbi:MAG: hypothetical protein JWQ66_4164 [Mucilaginibacter sp.]|nr:hypothetical protein [Mucilaginibacter sp.]